MSNATGIWDLVTYGQTPDYSKGVCSEVFISKKDKKFLRKLAESVRNLSDRPSENVKRKLWSNLNSLEFERPLIFVDPENGWNEVIKENDLKCSGKLARHWEVVLLKEIFWGESLMDDKPIDPYFDIGYTFSESNWGVNNKIHGGEDGGAYVWEALVKDFKDLRKIHFPKIEVDYKTTLETYELAKYVFNGLLKVRIKGYWWLTLGLSYYLVQLRGIEQTMIDFYDNPEILHQLMEIIRDGTLNYFDYLEKNNLLSLNNDGFVGSTALGYTNELPSNNYNGKVKTLDMWGFAESQDTDGISPKMFEEFIFKYQLPILARFGHNCYGCCEPLERRWYLIKNIPNLRRVSVSPWANLKKMAEYLEDKYIYSMKPNPCYISVANMDEDFIRKTIHKALEITKGCMVEIIINSTHTIGKNPNNLINWVRIVREEIEKIYDL